MRPEVVAALRCPICEQALELRGSLRCPRGHSFDPARQGYVQLTAAPLVHIGDSATMIRARQDFLTAGHYAPITSALADAAAASWPGGLVLDVGAGTGQHLAGVLAALPDADGLATDASKPAIRLAVHAHPRADAVICDAWQPLPVRTASVGVLLNVFAPRPAAEFARVLRPDGVLLVVTPTPEHLNELIAPLGLLQVDPDKAERLASSLDTLFIRSETTAIRTVMELGHDDVATLVGMGPSAWHVEPAALADAISSLPSPVSVTLAVTVSVYRPR